MNSIKFQLLISNKKDFLKIIFSHFKKALEESYEELFDDEVVELISFDYVKELSSNRFLIGFNLDFESDNAEEVIDVFCKNLDDEKFVEFILKYEDNNLFDSLKELYEEIFNIEMKLRRILSYIYISIYETDCFNFIDFQKNGPKLRGDETQEGEDFFKKNFQNEFFFLTFSQYRNLKFPEVVKSETLINLLADSSNFEELKKGIENIGVMKDERKEFIDFLNRIMQNLQSIEDVRNCVAHNRKPSEDQIDNYNIAKEDLIRDMDQFVSDLNYEGFEEYIKHKKIIISAFIYLEKAPASNLYRQSSSTIQFEDGTEEDIDFGDMEFNQYGDEDIGKEVKQQLRDYLEDDYDISGLEDDLIEIDFL